jgi:hypothetical protein
MRSIFGSLQDLNMDIVYGCEVHLQISGYAKNLNEYASMVLQEQYQ